MKVQTNQGTIDEIKKIIEAQKDQPSNVRIFVAGYGWGGPTLGLALDELKDTDLKDESNAVTFVMDKDLFEQMGEMKVEFMGNGYAVAPVAQEESGCSSCSGCGH